MPTLFAAITSAFIGIVFGLWLRSTSAKNEKSLLEKRAQELAVELTTARAGWAQAQAESVARAGFEPLAAERAATILQLTATCDGVRQELANTAASERAQAARISQLEAELNNEKKNLAEKLALLDSAKQTLANQFEALAGEILEKKTKSFAEGSQKELGSLLTPLRDQIKEFREKVEQAQSDSKTGVIKLETLIGTLGGLNQQLSEEARNLSSALRGSSKAQGDWGEFILRDLLEKAGMREGEEYSFQQCFPPMEVNGEKIKAPRTDVIVSLPGGRSLVIDSKVSLNAYADSVNAETEELRKSFLAEHLKSVRKHVGTLAKAGYHALPGIEAPDFVVLFVPVEPAFLAALQCDASLWADAYQQGILLVGPTTLLYVIRIVSVLWQQELQARSVQDVMNRGTALYEKFVGFVSDMEKVGSSLRNADSNYANAMKKLSEGPGNLIRQVEMLKQLGIRTSKQIPRTLLDTAGVEEPELALAAEAEEGVPVE